MKTVIQTITVIAVLMAGAPLFAQAAASGTSAGSGGTSVAPEVAETRAAAAQARKQQDEILQVLAERAGGYSRGGGTGPVLVVPAGQMSDEALAAANEDMNVMSRILAGALRQTGPTSAAGDVYGSVFNNGSWSFSSATSNAENIYLQGYGVLFTMRVRFPLSPSPDANEPQEKPAAKGGDQVWQQMRQDLYEPQTAPVDRSGVGREPRYSAERVESLKTAIITALKHAVNIRGLQPAESVVVTIIGQSPSSRLPMNEFGRPMTLPSDGTPAQPATVLTIRAKMSDVTSFSKGDLSLDQFRQKVQILSNPYLGGGTGSTTRSTGFGLTTRTRQRSDTSTSQGPPPIGQSAR